jgi:hypothetical protein
MHRNDFFIARASSDIPIACASLFSEFSITTHRDSGSSESRYPSAWHPIQQSVNRFQSSGLFRQQNSHPVGKRSLTGVDAQHHRGTHE